MAESLGNVFHNILENMQHSHEQLKGGEGQNKIDDSFSLQTFWIKLGVTTKSISNEVTKLCLAFSKPPLPDRNATYKMLQTLEVAYLDMLSTFYSLPKSQGIILRKEVHMKVLQLLESLISVVKSLKEKGEKIQKDRLMLTGCVWDACEAVDALPQNNLEATCRIVHREDNLVMDALQEIQEEVEANQAGPGLREDGEEEDNSRTWSNQDKELLHPCLGMVKAARSCLKKIGMTLKAKGKYESEEQISQLDDLVSKVVDVSPAVDDLVTSMYPPINKDAVKNSAVILKTRIQDILHMVKQSHYVTDEDQSWIDFLFKAVDHNNNKLHPLLT